MPRMSKKQKKKTYQEVLAEGPLPADFGELFDWALSNKEFQEAVGFTVEECPDEPTSED